MVKENSTELLIIGLLIHQGPIVLKMDAQNIMMDELISNVMDAQDDGILRDKDSGLRIEPSGPESNV